MEHLWDKLQKSAELYEPIHSKYRVVYHRIDLLSAVQKVNPDADVTDTPMAMVVPDPYWMAAAQAGHILPPVETYHRDREITANEPQEHPYAESIGPMSEEEAIEYLIMKEVPPEVWRDYRGNASVMKVVPVNLIPTSASYRNAWCINQNVRNTS